MSFHMAIGEDDRYFEPDLLALLGGGTCEHVTGSTVSHIAQCHDAPYALPYVPVLIEDQLGKSIQEILVEGV
ncbi:hypothetical protein ADZ36_25575 [Streptomyces fradiae]|uniref:Uncharacterized protein n=2 Tax=Streptomyces TaxID=1883 RepID=A0A420V0Q6_9ACTN|nr:hypothetical protein ADZ36_25575 [Streptomyces fradiae]OFA37825.1 hypothetical protein BEN35_28185 [Streptomyces fradiae]PQM19903.1 hypothetical protein Sfr7A_29485 [Streptomyces xinghaiensis]RKM94095.1 hypothetical protein SFRA_020120 [Streptomyces xinghaiensis]RNC69302.1 hypothetical protein DC095_030120 [Streptomyces xinghaiensis]